MVGNGMELSPCRYHLQPAGDGPVVTKPILSLASGRLVIGRRSATTGGPPVGSRQQGWAVRARKLMELDMHVDQEALSFREPGSDGEDPELPCTSESPPLLPPLPPRAWKHREADHLTVSRNLQRAPGSPSLSLGTLTGGSVPAGGPVLAQRSPREGSGSGVGESGRGNGFTAIRS